MYDYESSEELALIRKACRGDVKAFSELYARVYVELYKFALYTLKHPQDAEDAVSDAVVAAYENISKLQKEEAFRGWIFKILSNQCRSRFRGAVQSEELQPEFPAEEKDYAQSHDVREAFGILEEDERMIIAFSIFGGYSSDEIGGMMDKKSATVRSKKARALDKMRCALEQKGV